MTTAAHALPPLPLYPPPDPLKYRLETVDTPVERSWASPHLSCGSSPQRVGLATFVVIAHLAGLATIAHLANRPTAVPELTSIAVALIPAEPAIEQTSPAPVETPPQPEPVKPEVKPPPPKVQPKPKPKPKPIPKVTESPTALTQEEAAPEEPSPPESAEPTTDAPAAAAPSSPAPPGPPTGGDQITAARFDAAYLNNPTPPYPPLSRRLREEGQVMLRVLVSSDGQPSRIEVRTSSGSERLDRAAEQAVARWRFVPAKRGDTPVEAWVLVPIVFKLTGN
ncbi:energy transducer TonB [Thauera linaloolentis]|uniref:Protein TonB n=1 Tax=Thauera linaloolentis (strain DSM 12138 / JCM 21573 / CCUG 41526 / CIP 105981 / IAM 15112 / NBRC 102519 / 47Lol) TaxID=1123367 RepID=N6ZF21_THAL4|nr:energy transducer TonB [Thauera linaloolentis]ENO90749.1 TonB family protein [Thauera linaloolentis 47Lol = DSM 12138]